ncbi:MAG TPA: cation diffusion facilitator family transporter [Cerasibacillus sp.]|uniref:cation diffusion facilitator family transporter n=1 Tax=Cerasibacillus sp. TaxID=2498711 RepID=UPI002F41D5B5
MKFIQLLKKGNVSSGLAAIGNLIISIVKWIVAIISGNGTMYATAMHSLADTVNQTFVYTGSVLAEMKPTTRFPTGFGRVINIFCMVAVIVVTVMAYETIKTGWELWQHPRESSDFVLNIIVLLFAFIIDGYILYKTMNQILHETKVETEGNSFVLAFRHAKKASPATKLVFYEDLVATVGAVFAIIGIVLAQFFGILEADGIVSIIIGLLMLLVAFRVGYDNMIGLIGVKAPAEVEERIAKALLADNYVVDIYGMRVIQEGRAYHVDVTVELVKGLTLNEADDVKFKLSNQLLSEPNITDVVLGIIEDDDKKTWSPDR